MAHIEAKDTISVIGKYMLADVFPIVLDHDRSQGNRLVDMVDGKSYLDCYSFVASNPIGHNHPKMHDVEFEKKLLRVARGKPSNSDFYTVEMAEFVATLANVAMPKELQHLFLIEGGGVAVENALKAAFDWKVRLNIARGYSEERGSQVIHFREAFHGRMGYTLSLTNTADPRKYQYFPRFDWPRIANPKVSFPLSGKNLDDVVLVEQQAIAAMKEAFRVNKDDIAAIILEPIQAEGGDNHFRPEFHQALRQIADENEAMLIYDEVQSGVGITGKMWAYEHYGIVPDIVCFGKKLQVCGMFVGERINDVELHVFRETSRLNSTWGGNLTDMVRATRYLEIIQEENLVENARVVGLAFLDMLNRLQTAHPQRFSNARGLGLMCSIDLASVAERDALLDAIYDEGALCLKCGVRSLRFRPSLTFREPEVQELEQIISAALRKLGW